MKIERKLIKDGLGWGLGLWSLGYVLSLGLYFVVPSAMIGWIIAPIGTSATLGVLIKKIKSKNIRYYLMLGIIWLVLAVTLDYVMIVKLFNSSNYYKLAVYVYYALTLGLPVGVGTTRINPTKTN